ncbi:unnamed protein product [Caenorhabditis angaria]|uniref:tRNA:m(4)X modification enzyme TRM13 n=1 Tax=Caenorhabditis angaria TaxID=860376 RepID=A0A9P1IZH5_9PELO|nr:unnamed protein product [Caenorhabditis angaria]
MQESLQTCSYVLPKKNRRCRMLVKPGNLFCGEHAIFDTKNTNRIICPNDSKHTVLLCELEKHLLKCNSRISEEDYIRKDANAIVAETKFDEKIDRRPSEEEIISVIHKIWKYYEEIASHQLIIDFRHSNLVQNHINSNPIIGKDKKKHLIQIGSILEHLIENGDCRDEKGTCVFELGAGKGQLAYWISKSVPNVSIILMDRSGCRNKFDSQMRKENPNLDFQRFRCSIEHMDLSKIETLTNSNKIIAICKHFCGSATDAGIRSLINSGLKFDNSLLIPCCHHKSRFAEYGGHGLLRKLEIDDEGSFAALRYLASFATNGAESLSQTEYEENSWKNLYPPAELGRRAKAILELGRAEWLQELGYKTKVIEYVPADVSPENLLILAKKI